METSLLSMNTAIEAALDLEEIDSYTFRSKSLWAPPGARGVFGGHIIGQSLMAAIKTVPDSFILHSIHSYFVLPGNASKADDSKLSKYDLISFVRFANFV